MCIAVDAWSLLRIPGRPFLTTQFATTSTRTLRLPDRGSQIANGCGLRHSYGAAATCRVVIRSVAFPLSCPFVKRKLYPNVDFYSGIMYQAMGFKPEIFTVLFAIPRSVGWLAQWQEMITDPEQEIARPRHVYDWGPDTQRRSPRH